MLERDQVPAKARSESREGEAHVASSLEGRTVVQNHQEFRCEYCAFINLPAPLHYGTKPGHFETSKIHFPSTYVSILVCSRPQCAGLAGLAHSAALV